MSTKLDTEYLIKAERLTSFNIDTKDFESLERKSEIQHLFNKHFFPKFRLSKTIKQDVSKDKLNHLISLLKNEDVQMFKRMHNYNLSGIGPGEVTLFFLIDDAHLGGGSSAGIDLIIGSDKYEVKAVNISKEKMAKDFKLGGTFSLAPIIEGIKELQIQNNIKPTSEVCVSKIRKLREISPNRFKKIEKGYRALAYNNYFKNHEIIFINNSPSSKLGEIVGIKRVKKKDIFIERVTSGTVKPLVQL